MKRNKLLISILIIMMLIPMISYAINLPTESSFMTSDKNEASKGDKVELSIDLNLIEYQNFEFTLTSNTNLGGVTTEQENLNISSDNNSFKMIVNKSDLGVNQINLYYQIPEEIEIGSKIELIGNVKEYKNDDVEDGETEESLSKEVRISITVIKKQETTDKEFGGNELENEQNMDKMNNGQMANNQNSQSNTNNMQAQTKTTSSALSGNVETNTYNGESNNYLKTLEITEADINPNFAKTNTTYFMEVGSDVTKITINAEAEDDNATVNIYGNDNLQEGENKVLISITAENGSVKTYRIYVTKK